MSIGKTNMNNILSMENRIDYKSQIDGVLNKLMKFSDKLRGTYNPVDSQWINRFEKEFSVKLPDDYKYLLSKTNGLILGMYEIAGLYGTNFVEVCDLYNMYKFEHFEVQVPQYEYLIPFSPDNGNFYCFNTKVKTNNNASNQIIYWVSNYEYSDEDTPEIVYDCLADYIDDWIISHIEEWFNYDGSEK